MSVNGDYSQPVFVNGYACMNCSQVAEAKQGIDPSDPKAGPYGIDAKNDPTTALRQPAVSFGGSLADAQAQGGQNGQSGQSTTSGATPPPPFGFNAGSQVNFSA